MPFHLWDYHNRKRVYLYMTPATDQAKVRVEIWTASGDQTIQEKERYVWSGEMARPLFDDVAKYLLDQLACAVEEILNLQTMMDGEAGQLLSPDGPAT